MSKLIFRKTSEAVDHETQQETLPFSCGITKKPDGYFRTCLDTCELNRGTIQDAYPVPCIDKTSDSLQNSDGLVY